MSVSATREWGALDSRGHSVQFYDDDEALLAGLRGFAGGALLAGEAALVIASPEHRSSLRERLEESGLDVHLAIEQERYTALDAAGTLHKFMDGDHPNASRFFDIIGEVIERSAEPQLGIRRRQVAAYGEMVAVLHAAGRTVAALELEELWNALGEVKPFYLHCAYPLALFDRVRDAETLARIEAEHTLVV
ncbi:MAG: MEDS domain-containing protein [Chloroflexi bacterium]|nr:MEDS domain-containing protein [Chloroflexota bacterium]